MNPCMHAHKTGIDQKRFPNLQSFNEFVYLLAIKSAIFAVIHRVDQDLDMLGQRCLLQTKEQ